MYLVNGEQVPNREAAIYRAASLVADLQKRGFVEARSARALPEDNDGLEALVMLKAKPGGGTLFDGVWIGPASASRQTRLEPRSKPKRRDDGLTLVTFAQTIAEYARSSGDDVLLELVLTMVPAAGVGQTEKLADYYKPSKASMMVDSVALDGLDVTGLESEEADSLRRKLQKWNGGRGLYTWRYRDGSEARPGASGARRYISGGVRLIDLEDELVKGLSCYEDLMRAVKADPHASIHY